MVKKMQADIKLSRRLAGCTSKRLGELDFSEVEDARKGDCKWSLPQILKHVLVGMMAGQKGLGEVEEGFSAISTFMRMVLGFHRRIPDTTMRNALIKTGIESLRKVLHQTVFLALRRKALDAVGLPFHVVALDGKKTSTRIGDDGQMAQTVSDFEGETPKFSVATITACLISTLSKICLDAIPMPANTNEKGFFKVVLQSLLATYGKLFKMVTYDAGGNSKANANFVHTQGLFYLFAVKSDQPTLFKRAQQLLANLGPELSLAMTDEILSGEKVIRRVWITTAMNGFHRWSHLQIVLRVECQTIDPKTGAVKATYSRYFVTNAPQGTLSPEQWLLVVRSHWAVENNCHNTFDKIFQEDRRPFILQPHGMLVTMILRRIAYNLLSLFRSITQRADQKKQMPWKSLMRTVSQMLMKLEQDDLLPGSRLALRLGAG
jgi:hypothetical protein